MKRTHPNGFSHIILPIILVIVIFGIVSWTLYASRKKDNSAQNPTTSSATLQDKPQAVKRSSSPDVLPSLKSFRDNPTDQFLVDYAVIDTGFPYKGKNAVTPHSGGHVNYGPAWKSWPKGGTAPENYPPIYAVADGVVSTITKSLRVGNNDRYGINLAIAQDNGSRWNFEYSIEPFIPEPSPGYYLQFMKVKEGDKVKKGQVIGYMLTPPNVNGTHIHFELIEEKTNRFAAPDIFTTDVVSRFREHWGGGGFDGQGGIGKQIGLCMGYKLAAEENPYGTGAADCLLH